MMQYERKMMIETIEIDMIEREAGSKAGKQRSTQAHRAISII